MTVDCLNGIIKRIHMHNGKERAKNFLLHHRVIKSDSIHDSWFNVEIRLINSAAKSNFVSLNKFRNTQEVALIDNAAIVGTLLGVFSVVLKQCFSELRDETISSFFALKDVVRSVVCFV